MVTYTEKWQEVPLSEVADVRDGTHDSPQYVAYGYPLVTSKNLKNGKIDWSDIQYISKKDFDAINKRSKVDPNDILMGMIGTIGNIAMISKKCDFAIKNVALIKDVQKANMIYLYYYLQSKNATDQLVDQADGGNQKFIALNKIRNFATLLPSAPEQEHIAKILVCFDDHIDNLTELIEKKRNIRDGALEDLVSGRTRLDGFDYTWVEGRIGDILTILHGKNQHGVENTSGKYPILGTGGVIGRATEYLCDWECVLIGRKGTIDKPIYMKTPFWTIDTLYYSKPMENQCVRFQYYLFCTIPWYNYTESSGRPSLAKKTIESIEVKLPKYEEQVIIASVLTSMDEEIEALEKQRDKINQIREGAMDDLLTGRVRLKV